MNSASCTCTLTCSLSGLSRIPAVTADFFGILNALTVASTLLGLGAFGVLIGDEIGVQLGDHRIMGGCAW